MRRNARRRARPGMPHAAGPAAVALLTALAACLLLSSAAASAAPLSFSPPTVTSLAAVKLARLLASDGGAHDQFGSAVAVSGDSLIVGAPGSSAAYVFNSSGSGWTQQAKLVPSAGDAVRDFGYAVAISGDTALVAAQADDDSECFAYVFVRSATAWSQQARLSVPGTQVYLSGGDMVALSGDTAVLGDEFETVGGNVAQGSAYVFTRSGTVWSEQARLVAPDGAADDRFGSSVALSGDTVLVSAFSDNFGPNAEDQGSVYVFTRSDSTWTQQAKLWASGGGFADYFGFSLAFSGETALIGSDWEGRASVFTRTGTTWSQRAILPTCDYDGVTPSLALDGSTALVSVPVGPRPSQGTVCYFAGSGASWTEQSRLTVAPIFDWVGIAPPVALAGRTAFVGAPADAVGPNVEQGSLFVYGLAAPRPPSSTLKASPHTLKVGKTVILSGVVMPFSVSNMRVSIFRRVGTKLKLLRTRPLGFSGAFRWATKLTKPGIWSFVATYKSGGVTYKSKTVSVTVHT
jgi:hypothetical protein